MSAPNEVIHQSVRLKIMAALNVLAPDAALEFTRLKALANATDGNLGAHLDTLERAGYVTSEKLFSGKKPQTRIRATAAGRRAFAEHVAYLREILDNGAVPRAARKS
jgi:DNA-binding MarR family transcriptional regulator